MNDVQQSVGLRPEALLQILEVTRRLAAPFDLQSVLTEIGEAARSVLHAERATVWLYEPALESLVLAGSPDAQPVRGRLDQGILGLTARTREIVNVPDCRTDSRFDPAVDLDYDNDVRCMLSVPLVEQNSLVGVLQVVDSIHGYFTAEDERIAATLAAQCVVFIQRERLTRTVVLAEKLDREIKLARDIQMSTLPSDMPRVAGYDMAGQFCPADDTGGDTFDLVMLDDQRLFVLLGDASGHGIGPALSSTQMTGMLRVALRLGADLDAIFTHVNNQLVEDLPEEHFVTAFLGMLDPRRHEIVYHAAGQGPLLHYHAATGECEWRPPTTFPMGFMRYPSLDAPAQIALEPGDVLALISDGAYERENATQQQFGTEGVERVVGLNHHRADVRGAGAASRGPARFRGRRPSGRRRNDRSAPAPSGGQRRHDGPSLLQAQLRFAGCRVPVRRGLPPGQVHRHERARTGQFHRRRAIHEHGQVQPGNEHDIALSLGCTAQVLTVRLTDFDVEPFDVTRGPPVDIDKPAAGTADRWALACTSCARWPTPCATSSPTGAVPSPSQWRWGNRDVRNRSGCGG